MLSVSGMGNPTPSVENIHLATLGSRGAAHLGLSPYKGGIAGVTTRRYASTAAYITGCSSGVTQDKYIWELSGFVPFQVGSL